MTADNEKQNEAEELILEEEEEIIREVEAEKKPAKAAAEPAKKNEKQSREKAKAKKQNGFIAYMKKADPIAMTCFIVIILAFATVLGSYINDEYFASESSGTASKGSTVEVEYVGSYLGYYDDAGAVIFDTNIESVADDSTMIFSSKWKAKDSYDLLSFSIGGTTVIKAFGDACAGHKVGDVVKVEVPASDDAYGVLERIDHAGMYVVLDRSGEMTLDQFNEVTGQTYTSSSFPVSPSLIENGDFYATYDSATEKVNYTFVTLTEGETKLATGAEVSISEITASNFKLTYTTSGNSVLTGIVPDADGNMQAVYFEHLSGSDSFTYWVSDCTANAEQKGETMYFYIKIKSISE